MIRAVSCVFVLGLIACSRPDSESYEPVSDVDVRASLVSLAELKSASGEAFVAEVEFEIDNRSASEVMFDANMVVAEIGGVTSYLTLHNGLASRADTASFLLAPGVSIHRLLVHFQAAVPQRHDADFTVLSFGLAER